MNNEILWKNILEELKISVSKAIFQMLFPNTSLVSLENNVATIGCPSSYVIDIIEKRYYSLVKEILDRQTKNNNSLVFIVKSTIIKSTEEGPLFNQENKEIKSVNDTKLRSDFTFENFAVSSSNQLPFAAASAVAKNPGTAYNPLFLWGGVGVGKTHLMHAIGHEILKTNPNAKIVSCPGEEFTNEIIIAIKTKTTDAFKKKYRSAKLLLLDDIQFIAGKITVQEEFFHTFNAILREGGQVVLTSDRPPEEIAKLEERLRSRFQAGLIVDIPTPDFELRTAILLIKAKQKKLDIDMNMAQLIANSINEIRAIEGFLVRLITETKAKNIPVSEELIRKLLGKKTNESQTSLKIIKPKEIIEAVALYYNLKSSQFRSPTRVREIVYPRQILMYLLRVEFKLPLTQVGDLLGGRDHTTIMHGVEKITNLLKEKEEIQVDISQIKQKLC